MKERRLGPEVVLEGGWRNQPSEWNFLGSVPAIIWAKDPGQITFVSELQFFSSIKWA